MKKIESRPVNLIAKRILVGTSLFTYGMIFLIFLFTLGRSNLTNIQFNGCCVNAAIIIAISLCLNAYNTYYVLKRILAFKQKHLLIAMIWLPLVGVVANFIIIRQQKHIYKNLQLAKDPNWKPKKEPLQVQILLVIVTLVVVLAIWLVYSIEGHFSNESGEAYTIPGIFDVILSPIKGFIDGSEVIVYLLIMGIFLQVINASKALEAGIGRLVKKLRGKELIIIPIIMILFSIGGTTFGMCEETIAFYAIVMPIVLAAGFDGITGVVIILFGAGLGVCSSIINPFMIMTSVDAVNAANISGLVLTSYDGMIFRIIVYVVFLVAGIGFTTFYAYRVKNNPERSLVYEYRDLHTKTFKFDEKAIPEFTIKRKITLIVFALCFVMLIVGAIPWKDLTGWDGFEQLNTWLTWNFPFLSTGQGAVGSWSLASFALLFLAGSIIVGAMNWNGANDFYGHVLVGAKDFLSVTFVIAVARGISLILTSSGFSVMIADGVSQVLSINKIMGTIVLFFAFIAISIFIPSTSGFAYTIFGPIAAPAMYQATINYSIAGGIASTSIANGLVNLSSPTAGPFVIGCEMAKVPLKNFYKATWKLLGALLLISIALLVAGSFLPASIMGR